MLAFEPAAYADVYAASNFSNGTNAAPKRPYTLGLGDVGASWPFAFHAFDAGATARLGFQWGG